MERLGKMTDADAVGGDLIASRLSAMDTIFNSGSQEAGLAVGTLIPVDGRVNN